MKLAKGVEWTTHVCTILALLPEGKGLSVDALSEFFEIPTAYLAKQMQLLRRAGIVESLRGKGGGYRLALSPDDVSLLDIVVAIEGSMPAFRCTEIRQNGPCRVKRKECKRPCEIATAFSEAEQAYRKALSTRTLASIMQEIAANASREHLLELANWLNGQLV